MALKFNAKLLTKKLDSLSKVRAINFAPAVRKFAGNTLNTAVKLTPAREAGLITKNQRKQYANRINYIPSVHTLEDPTLIVNKQGEHWIYARGLWFNAEWKLPDDVWSAYQELEAERQRRIGLSQAEFLRMRKISRGLYKFSWVQCGLSLGIRVLAPAFAMSAKSRRKPMKAPPKGYAIARGTQRTFSIQIRNPFLDIRTKYWHGNGKQILARAAAMNRGRFEADIAAIATEEIRRARRA